MNKKIDTHTSISVPVTDRYITEFINLKCCKDILHLFPNAKEITESMAAFGALREIRGMFGKNGIIADPLFSCFFPGDGYYPRTGALFAHRTRWNCTSVDPLSKNLGMAGFRRVTQLRGKMQDHHFTGLKGFGIVHVHSHATMDESLSAFNVLPDFFITIQCCVNQSTEKMRLIKKYRDAGIFSPEDEVQIWVK